MRSTRNRPLIDIQTVDHVGIRVADLDRALAFYALFGFVAEHRAQNDAVVVIKNRHKVEINLIYNANNDGDGKNILMDVPDKYPGYTHVAFRVGSIAATIAMLRENNIRITQGPVSFGRDGHISVFLRDPDRNVIELRGREEDLSKLGGVEVYVPQN
ncbi:MAG: VOC family protein [Betaproteobacteria bacterium]|nr:MAG: VOC family protein [Betaproteobacteria bacterium]